MQQYLFGILRAILGLSSNGLMARTGDGTVAVRTLQAGSGVSITNADGVSGNPVIGMVGFVGLTPGSSIANTIQSSGNYTELNIKAFTSQTQPLQTWQTSAGDNIMFVNPDGRFACGPGAAVGSYQMTILRSGNYDAVNYIGRFIGAGPSDTSGLQVGFWAYPSATGVNRWAGIGAGDSSGYRPLILNTVGGSKAPVGIGTTVTPYQCSIGGSLGFSPGSSVTPSANGDVVFELTNNTTLTAKARGSDGTVRSGTITLS